MQTVNGYVGRVLNGCMSLALMAAIFFSSASSVAEPLVISRVGGHLQERVEMLYPVAEYVVNQLNSTAYNEARVKYSLNQHELIRFIRNGEVHWVSESPYVAALLAHEVDMVPLVKHSKQGVYSYGSVLVSPLGLKDVSHLIGKKIAVEDPGSFSAFFVIYRHLIEQGYKVNFLFAPREAGLAGHINLVFSGNVENSISWLANGVVEAAVMGDHEYKNPALFSGSLKARTRVLFESEQYPRTIELVSRTVAAEDRDQLRSVMLRMSHDPAAAPVLAACENSSGFAPLTQGDLDQLTGIYRFIQGRSSSQ